MNEKAPIPEIDALDRLAFVLHGHKAAPRDFIGGCNANILSDAAERIAALQAEVDALKAYRAEVKKELMAEIMADPGNKLFGMPLAEVRRLILARATPPQDVEKS